MHIYNARTYLNISYLLIHIKGIKDTENKLCENDDGERGWYCLFYYLYHFFSLVCVCVYVCVCVCVCVCVNNGNLNN